MALSLVAFIDSRLRRHHAIHEFTSSAECIFRIQLIRCGCEVQLRDGTPLRRNDRVIDLHFWNEQLPRMPDGGPTLGWARRFTRVFDASLRELAHHLADRSDLEDVTAIRVNMSVGTAQQRDQLSRIVARYGFETVQEPRPRSAGERLLRFGENILYFMMVYAINPAALRGEVLRRARAVAYLPRLAFERQYLQNCACAPAPVATSAFLSRSIARTPANGLRRREN